MNIIRIGVAGIVAWGILFPTTSAQSPPRRNRAEETEYQLIAVIDAIVEHHVDPPTRQQLIHDSLRRAASISNTVLPPGIAQEISSAAPDTLTELLRQHLREMAPWDGRIENGGQRRPISLTGLIPRYVQTTSPDANRIEEQLTANRYVGIGITLQTNDKHKRCSMGTVFPEGPAAIVGAKDGDLILKVDGRNTAGKSIVDLVNVLRGAAGTDVEVELRQPDEDETRTYTITRGVVPISSIGPITYSRDRRAVGIRIEKISGSTVHELRKMESRLNDDTELVILDVRYVRNHDLHNGKLLANVLIDGGVVGGVETNAGVQKFSAEPERLFSNRRLVLLIGPNTSGTIEWIAAALQDHDQAVLVGASTSGRGFVMATVPTAAPDLMVTLPVGRLRRADGGRLDEPNESMLDHTLEVVAANAFSAITKLYPRAAPRRKGPGIHPDIIDFVGQIPVKNQPSEAGRAAMIERVAKLVVPKGRPPVIPESGTEP